MRRLLNRRLLKCCELKSAAFGTWSKLAADFNANPVACQKLSEMSETTTGLFGIPELDSHEGFHILKDRCLGDADRLLNEAVSPQRSRKIVEVLDELSDTLCKVADLAEFVRVAHPSTSYSQAAEVACAAVSSVVEKFNTHVGMYTALKEVVTKGDKVTTNSFDDHVASLFLFDFEQSGIHLSKTQRHMVVELNDRILNLGQRFIAGCYIPRVVHRKQIPENLQYLFPSNGDRIVVAGVSSDANPLIREVAYKIFYSPDKHQEKLLDQLLEARHRLANICGFKTYVERTLGLSLVEKPSVVMDFLDTLSTQLRPYADADFVLMNKMKALNKTAGSRPIAMWDVHYFTYKLRKEKFKVTGLDYSAYLSLGACMEGLSNLFYKLFKIKLVTVDTDPGETWAPEIYKLAVVHDTEGDLGYIYCDFYERHGKQNQDCHFTIRGGRSLPDGSYQQPIVVLMLNLPPPTPSRPSLLSPGMVDNLFHEMGHAMHSMLARTRYQHVTGTRCSTDFAEVPSILMEYFAADPRVMKTFARHFQTKEPMPEELLQRLCASKRLFAASEMQAQVFYSALDQIYYGSLPQGGTTTEILAETQRKYYSLPFVENTSWQLRFSHLVNYGAKYYSYLVSRAVATKIWQTYFKEDPFSSVAGERYRRECLAHGGGKPPKKLVADFLKEEPTPKVLAEALIKEIDASQEYKKFVD